MIDVDSFDFCFREFEVKYHKKKIYRPESNLPLKKKSNKIKKLLMQRSNNMMSLEDDKDYITEEENSCSN